LAVARSAGLEAAAAPAGPSRTRRGPRRGGRWSRGGRSRRRAWRRGEGGRPSPASLPHPRPRRRNLRALGAVPQRVEAGVRLVRLGAGDLLPGERVRELGLARAMSSLRAAPSGSSLLVSRADARVSRASWRWSLACGARSAPISCAARTSASACTRRSAGSGGAVAQAQPSESSAPAVQRRIEFSSPDDPATCSWRVQRATARARPLRAAPSGSAGSSPRVVL
jgi:hypothetical protein